MTNTKDAKRSRGWRDHIAEYTRDGNTLQMTDKNSGCMSKLNAPTLVFHNICDDNDEIVHTD